MELVKLGLKDINQKEFFYVENKKFRETKELLNETIEENNLDSLSFALRGMFSREIWANNHIEGLNDSLLTIEGVINDNYIADDSVKSRIINLYNAYKYILEHDHIDKESLRELYEIISKDQLDEDSIKNMGDYYREKDVFILRGGRLDASYDNGLTPSKIDEYMKRYFDFLNGYEANSKIDEYIKSQILHYYFVYIHPYFDVNGRTARTVAIWYLLNKKAYPYTIFNRAISLNQTGYDKKIAIASRSNNLSLFLNTMLEKVLQEMQKEYVMDRINLAVGETLSNVDYEILLYYLSIRSEKNLKNFVDYFNKQTGQKLKPSVVLKRYLIPLAKKGVFRIYKYGSNENLRIELKDLDLDYNKVNKLKI